jgi:hypothetical protein
VLLDSLKPPRALTVCRRPSAGTSSVCFCVDTGARSRLLWWRSSRFSGAAVLLEGCPTCKMANLRCQTPRVDPMLHRFPSFQMCPSMWEVCSFLDAKVSSSFGRDRNEICGGSPRQSPSVVTRDIVASHPHIYIYLQGHRVPPLVSCRVKIRSLVTLLQFVSTSCTVPLA